MTRTPLALGLLVLPFLGLACGGGGDLGTGPAGLASPSPSPTTPFVPAPAPALWADDGCALCHGDDGSGDGAPDIRCTSYDALDSYVRAVGTSHVGGAYPSLTDENLLALEAFLRSPDCPGTVPGGPTPPPPSGGLPADHTENEDGVFHHPDYESNLSTCMTCHGPNLEGTSVAPACASCHGTGGFDDDAFDDDDDEADDSDDEADEADDDDDADEADDDDDADEADDDDDVDEADDDEEDEESSDDD